MKAPALPHFPGCTSGRVTSTSAATTVAVLALAGLAGCTTIHASRPAPDGAPSHERPPAISGRAVRVADGDTLTVRTTDTRVTVRLLGIDAPEISHGSRPAECGGPQAAAALRALVKDRDVDVRTDPASDTHDRYGRLLGYVDLQGHDVACSSSPTGTPTPGTPRAPLRPPAGTPTGTKAAAPPPTAAAPGPAAPPWAVPRRCGPPQRRDPPVAIEGANPGADSPRDSP